MSNNLIAYFSASEVTARLAKTRAKAVFLKSSQHKPDPIFYGDSNAVQGIIALSESGAEIKPKAVWEILLQEIHQLYRLPTQF